MFTNVHELGITKYLQLPVLFDSRDTEAIEPGKKIDTTHMWLGLQRQSLIHCLAYATSRAAKCTCAVLSAYCPSGGTGLVQSGVGCN